MGQNYKKGKKLYHFKVTSRALLHLKTCQKTSANEVKKRTFLLCRSKITLKMNFRSKTPEQNVFFTKTYFFQNSSGMIVGHSEHAYAIRIHPNRCSNAPVTFVADRCGVRYPTHALSGLGQRIFKFNSVCYCWQTIA